ncbi:MAG: 4-(cytidine 5'-diphospho)-2-C-methyl-D-erythritol kinase [Candidatus Marinimicrobia bacterium]|nr:4-(cytidine 5'-diphospho)-2-C-methyl-D-erythritol kinase [Candidatus Neomarinimicrobiota bacterium]
MNSIDLKAHAKVNIGLQVKNQREDKLHNIHTIFQELELHDTISLEKQQRNWSIKINDSTIPTDESNTCIQAYLAVKQLFPKIDGISITLNKSIPSGAGLGGGSSNAAATLIGLRELYNLSLNNKELSEIAVKIGADVPFFILGGTQIGDGIGDVLLKINKPIIGFYLLVIPNIFISTAWAYKALKKHLKDDTDRPNFAHFLEGNNLSKAIFDNDFERIVIPTYPKIGEIKEGLLKAGASYASLSGSGSTVFGIYDDEARAKQAESHFQKQYHALLTRPTNI